MIDHDARRFRGLLLPLFAGLLAHTAASQDPERHVHGSQAFSCELPEGWRHLTPNEALDLSRRADTGIPSDLLVPTTAAFYPYGRVDSWLTGEFDGRCMTVQTVDGECPTDESGLALVQAAAAEARENWTAEVRSATPAKVGTDDHPVIEARVRYEHSDLEQATDAIVLFAPTAGRTVVITFRAWEGDFSDAEPVFRSISQSLRFAQKARGPVELSDRVLNPLLVGGLVMVILLVLRHKRRGTPGTPA